MKKQTVNIFVLLIVQKHLRTIYAENIRCQKVDFNRQSSVVTEFDECAGQPAPNILKINSYSATTITPFRSTSEFHLSAIEGLSCLLSTSIFTLDINTEIRTAIFLGSVAAGVWVEVLILDNSGDATDVVVRLDESNGWIEISGKVNRSIENAQIEISTNMNANCEMAMEYLYVLNSDVLDDECVDEDTEPVITTTTDEPHPTSETEDPIETDPPETTDQPESTDPPQTTDPTETEDGNTTENDATTIMTTTTTSESAPQTQSILWVSLSILFFATTIVTLAGIFYFIWLYRRLSSQQRTEQLGTTTSTLPRLQVKNGIIDGDSVIVGIDKSRPIE